MNFKLIYFYDKFNIMYNLYITDFLDSFTVIISKYDLKITKKKKNVKGILTYLQNLNIYIFSFQIRLIMEC